MIRSGPDCIFFLETSVRQDSVMERELDKDLKALRAVYESGKNIRVYVAYGEALRRKGSLKEALSIVRDGLEHDPDNAAALSVLARVYVDLDRVEESIVQAKRALEIEPEAFGAKLALAKACMASDRVKEARTLLGDLKITHEAHPEVEALERDVSTRFDEKEKRRLSLYQGGRFERKHSWIEYLKAIGAIPEVVNQMVVEVDTGDLNKVRIVEAQWAGIFEIIKVFVSFVGDQGLGLCQKGMIELEKTTYLFYYKEENLLLIEAVPWARLGKVRYKIEHILSQIR